MYSLLMLPRVVDFVGMDIEDIKLKTVCLPPQYSVTMTNKKHSKSL
jgi:hypothetical protein